MHRIDTPSATPEDQFTEGSPSGGVPATTVTAAWLNDVQEELMSILAAAGVAPVKGDQNQVLEALNTLFGGSLVTPPQFDNDTSPATTAFVQRALGNDSGVVIMATNRTLTAADAGRYLFVNTNNAVITLPNPASLALGVKFRIAQGNLTAGGTINAPAGVTIGNITAGGTVTSVAMQQSTEYVLTVVSSTAYQLTILQPGVGTGQSWQDVTGSRADGVTYTNTTGRAIAVSIYSSENVTSGSRSVVLQIGGLNMGRIDTNGIDDAQLFAIIPPGATYRATINNYTLGTNLFWTELR